MQLTFRVTATGDTVDTLDFAIPPDSLSNELVFTGGDPDDIANWS